MEYQQGTTGVFIEGEDIPLNNVLSRAYKKTIETPHLNFLYMWKVDEMYCAFHIEYRYRFGYWLCGVNIYEDIYEDMSDEWKGLRQNRLELNIKLNKELVRGNRNLTIRLIRWIYKNIKGKELPLQVKIDPRLDLYFPFFVKRLGLEAIRKGNNGILVEFKVLERNTMELLYEGLV